MNHSLSVLFLFLFVANVFAVEVPSEIVVEKNVPYVADGGVRQQLDLYFPKNFPKDFNKTGKPYPLIVAIHGGAWAMGAKDMEHYMLDGVFGAILNDGAYVLAAINYRLTDQGPFPMQLEDCKSAIRWLRAHAETYNIDPDRIGVWGGSAGGHLASLVGLTDNVKEFDVGEHLDRSSRVQAVCDFCGKTDLMLIVSDPDYKKMPHVEHIERFLDKQIPEAEKEARRASPITYVSKNAPPFLIVHGTVDPVNPFVHAERLKAVFDKTGVPCTLYPLMDTKHDGPLFVAPETMSTMMRFFDRHLKHEK